jgi:hypothetical protein
MSKPVAAPRAVLTTLRALTVARGLSLWEALELSRCGRTDRQAVVNVLAAAGGRDVLALRGQAAAALVARVMTPPAAPRYDVRAESCELGEWAERDLEEAYLALAEDRAAEATRHPLGATTWEALAAVEAQLGEGPRPMPQRLAAVAEQVWLLDVASRLHGARCALDAWRAASVDPGPGLEAAERSLRSLGDRMMARVGREAPASVRRRLARAVAA